MPQRLPEPFARCDELQLPDDGLSDDRTNADVVIKSSERADTGATGGTQGLTTPNDARAQIGSFEVGHTGDVGHYACVILGNKDNVRPVYAARRGNNSAVGAYPSMNPGSKTTTYQSLEGDIRPYKAGNTGNSSAVGHGSSTTSNPPGKCSQEELISLPLECD